MVGSLTDPISLQNVHILQGSLIDPMRGTIRYRLLRCLWPGSSSGSVTSIHPPATSSATAFLVVTRVVSPASRISVRVPGQHSPRAFARLASASNTAFREPVTLASRASRIHRNASVGLVQFVTFPARNLHHLAPRSADYRLGRAHVRDQAAGLSALSRSRCAAISSLRHREHWGPTRSGFGNRPALINRYNVGFETAAIRHTARAVIRW